MRVYIACNKSRFYGHISRNCQTPIVPTVPCNKNEEAGNGNRDGEAEMVERERFTAHTCNPNEEGKNHNVANQGNDGVIIDNYYGDNLVVTKIRKK